MSILSAKLLHTCAVLLLCCVGVLSTASCDTAKQHQEQCFSVLGLSFLDMDNAVKHHKDVCRNQQLYAAAMRCALNVNTTCPSSMGLWSQTLLDDDRMEDWISYFCNHIQDDRLMTLVPLSPYKTLPSVPRVRRDLCTNPTRLQQNMVRCYTSEGLRFQTEDISTAAQSEKSFTNAMFQSQENLRALCSTDATVRQRANNCAFGMARNCMPVRYRDLIQSPTQINNLMEYMCRHYEEIDMSCVNGKATELYQCAYGKGIQIGLQSSDFKSLLCRVYVATAECHNEVLASCGCNTTRLYDRVVKEYFNPPACPPVTVPAPCGPGQNSIAAVPRFSPRQESDSRADVALAAVPRFSPRQESDSRADVGATSQLSASVVALVLAALMANIFSV